MDEVGAADQIPAALGEEGRDDAINAIAFDMRMLLASDDGIAMSVSATTRPMRSGEVDGRDYHFVSDEGFEEMVAQGAFL